MTASDKNARLKWRIIFSDGFTPVRRFSTHRAAMNEADRSYRHRIYVWVRHESSGEAWLRDHGRWFKRTDAVEKTERRA